MTLKRNLSGAENRNQMKKKKHSSFFSGLDGSAESGISSALGQKKKMARTTVGAVIDTNELVEPNNEPMSRNQRRKLKWQQEHERMAALVPEWAKGTGLNLYRYIKDTKMIDIETIMNKYLEENNIEIIDGEIADKNSEKSMKKPDRIVEKTSELLRMERIQKSTYIDKAKLHDGEQNVDTYFKDACAPNLETKFSEMHLPKQLIKAIHAMKYTTPTPIQSATIPVAMAGKDICGCAATGTGKTAAFMLPALSRLLMAQRLLGGERQHVATRVLVLVPTRELAVQVFQMTEALTRYCKVQIGLAVGGLELKVQEEDLLKQPDIVIATPGTLLRFIKRLEGFTLKDVEILILDEADRILDHYFEEQMVDIIAACSPHRQTLFFSATMTAGVRGLAAAALTEPVKIFVNTDINVAAGLRQEYVLLREDDELTRKATLVYLLVNDLSNHTLVFLPTKLMCHNLYVVLRLCGLKVGELHGRLPQCARLQNLANFANGNIRILLATDLAARGLDIQGVHTVINYKVTSNYDTYVHKVGRTARMGNQGLALNLVPQSDYKKLKIIKKMSKTAMYQRKIDKDEVEFWKVKMVKLFEVAKIILERERYEIKYKREDHLLERMEGVKRRVERQEAQAAREKTARDKDTEAQKKVLDAIRLQIECDFKQKPVTSRRRKQKSIAEPTDQISNSKKKKLAKFVERAAMFSKVKKKELQESVEQE